MHNHHVKQRTPRQVVQALLGLSAALLLACTSGGSGGGQPQRVESAPQAAAPASAAAPAGGNSYLPKPGDALIPIKVGTAAVTGGFVQLYVGIDSGIFQKYGFNVEQTFIANTAAALAALAINDIQFFYGAADGTIPALASSAEAKIVADPLYGMPYVLIAAPDVKTGADLRGKSIGMARVGDLSERVSRLAVEHYGLRPNVDVELRPIGGSQPERYQMLLAGVVQGVAITPPLDAQGRKDGLNVLFELSDLNQPFIYSALHASNGMIRDNPHMVQRFVAAVAEAVYFTEKNPDAARASLRKMLKLEDAEALDSAYNAYARKLVNRRMTVPYDAVSLAIEEARETGTQVVVRNPEEIATNQFVDELDRNGFLQQLWGAELPPK